MGFGSVWLGVFGLPRATRSEPGHTGLRDRRERREGTSVCGCIQEEDEEEETINEDSKTAPDGGRDGGTDSELGRGCDGSA